MRIHQIQATKPPRHALAIYQYDVKTETYAWEKGGTGNSLEPGGSISCLLQVKIVELMSPIYQGKNIAQIRERPWLKQVLCIFWKFSSHTIKKKHWLTFTDDIEN